MKVRQGRRLHVAATFEILLCRALLMCECVWGGGALARARGRAGVRVRVCTRASVQVEDRGGFPKVPICRSSVLSLLGDSFVI